MLSSSPSSSPHTGVPANATDPAINSDSGSFLFSEEESHRRGRFPFPAGGDSFLNRFRISFTSFSSSFPGFFLFFFLTLFFLLFSPLLPFPARAAAEEGQASHGMKNPVRIVSLSPALTETVVQLGGRDSLVGRSTACNYPESILSLPCAGDFGIPNLERLLTLRPTHFIDNDLMDEKVKKILEKSGITIEIHQCRNIADYRDWVLRLGKILNRENAAKKEIKRMDEVMEKLRENTCSIPPDKRKRAVWVVWESPLMLAGKGSLPDFILRSAGAVNAAGEVSPEYFYASFEWLLQENPQVLVWPELDAERKKRLAKDPLWSELDAVRNGRIIDDISPDLLLRPGPRLFEGMKELQKRLLLPPLPLSSRLSLISSRLSLIPCLSVKTHLKEPAFPALRSNEVLHNTSCSTRCNTRCNTLCNTL